jgi:hypothetical protein
MALGALGSLLSCKVRHGASPRWTKNLTRKKKKCERDVRMGPAKEIGEGSMAAFIPRMKDHLGKIFPKLEPGWFQILTEAWRLWYHGH